MKKSDHSLGMYAGISRRDFLNGASVAISAGLFPELSSAQDIGQQDLAGYYPPRRSGMRGSHPGSFEVAHEARDGASWDAVPTDEEYDLAVVGGGLSGLSAAYFFRQAAGRDAKILVLDNHDDFGGHAKRNEFVIDDRLMIGFGGTMFISAPSSYPGTAKRLIRELGIDAQRFYSAFDHDLYSSLGLSQGTFFDKETFGRDHLAVGDLSEPDVLVEAPLSSQARRDLARLYADERHYLGDMDTAQRLDYLVNNSYREYLSTRADIGDEALRVLQSHPKGVWAVGIDALPARTAWSSGYPGFANLEVPYVSTGDCEEEPNIFHFPDGNATIARLLVRAMIPGVAHGDDMVDIVTAPFDYRKLDQPRSGVRIRLNSTVVRVKHRKGDSGPVEVSYVREGQGRRITARKVVLACYHAIIPHLCPEMPQSQRALLSYALRAPLVYTNVLIRNWRSFHKLGIHGAICPGSYHHRVRLDFPVSLGEYRFAKTPDEPTILHMTRVPGQPGLPAREQFAAGKRDLLSTPFETFERNIRDQLERVLGEGGFDPARDIAGITVNRWPHGYAYGYDPESDRVAFEPSQWPADQRPWVTASETFGNIAIAATDAASNAMTESAIVEAYRAINDLT